MQYWCIDGKYRIYVARLRNGGKMSFINTWWSVNDLWIPKQNGITLYEWIIYHGYGHWWWNEKTVLKHNYVLLVEKIENKIMIISRSTVCTWCLVLSAITIWWTTAVIISYAPSIRTWLEVLLRWTFAYEYEIWTNQKIDNKTKWKISLLIVFLWSFHCLIMSSPVHSLLSGSVRCQR